VVRKLVMLGAVLCVCTIPVAAGANDRDQFERLLKKTTSAGAEPDRFACACGQGLAAAGVVQRFFDDPDGVFRLKCVIPQFTAAGALQSETPCNTQWVPIGK
jgi:hypothetical protein